MGNADVYAELSLIFHSIFDDDTIVLTPELTAKDVMEWDSLNHIRLILAVEKHYTIKFSVTEISDLKNVGEFVSLIAKKRSHA